MKSPPLQIERQLQLPTAQLQLVHLFHSAPSEHLFARRDAFWVELCMTPRRPEARARFIDRWGPHRFSQMGSIIALPPRFNIHLGHQGGRHTSLLCALQADAIHRWLPRDFEWTDRRLEACLDISSASIRGLLQRLAQDMRAPGVASRELCEALTVQLSIEIARYLIAIDAPTERGGLAAWRLAAIDKRLAEPGEAPTLPELADLCKISTRQLTRGFRTSRGCSIGDYTAQVRIEAAKRRLATEEGLKSIANAMGFASQSTFTFTFRRATGLTPGEFRRRVLQPSEEQVEVA